MILCAAVRLLCNNFPHVSVEKMAIVAVKAKDSNTLR